MDRQEIIHLEQAFNQSYLDYLGDGGFNTVADRPRSAGWTTPSWGVFRTRKKVGALVGRIIFENGDHFYIGPTSWFNGPVVPFSRTEIADFYFAFRESRPLRHERFGLLIGKRTFNIKGSEIIDYEDSGKTDGLNSRIGGA